MNAKLLLIIFTLSVIPVTAQTRSEIEQRYGKPMLAYTVSEQIWMTPDFAADGQVCRMRFYAKRFDHETAFINSDLRYWELKPFLNELVPPSSRGKRTNWFGMSTLTGSSITTVYDYEKVTFNFGDSLSIGIDPEAVKRHRDQTGIVSLDNLEAASEPPKPPLPHEDDFDGSGDPEVVILQWSDRVCAQDQNAAASMANAAVAELERQYGPPEKIYSDGSISMTPSFDADGQVCRMWLYPKRVSAASVHVGKIMLFDELQDVLNRLVPRDQRGRMGERADSDFSAKVGSTLYPYGKFLFTFWTTLHQRTAQSPLSPPAVPVQPAVQRSADDFRRTDDTGLVVVKWRRRQCSND